MSSKSCKLEKDLCRCCHAEGSFHNLSQPLSHLGKKEVYSEMLQSALNIDLSPVSGPLCAKTYTICEGCSLRLRDATHFRQQVMTCEKRFKDLYYNALTLSNGAVEVKQEIPQSYDRELLAYEQIEIKVEYPQQDDGNEDDNGGFDMQFDDNDDVPLKPKLEVINTIEYDDDEDDKKAFHMEFDAEKGKAKAKPRRKAKRPKIQNDDESETTDEDKTHYPKWFVKLPNVALNSADYKQEGCTYVCQYCDKIYVKKDILRNHVHAKHYNMPKFSCQYCDEEFMTPSQLNAHKLDEHSIDDRFKCKSCNAAFNKRANLQRHRNDYHKRRKGTCCEFCGFVSSNAKAMDSHKLQHRPEKDHHCRFCLKSFLRKATLRIHERVHSNVKKVWMEC